MKKILLVFLCLFLYGCDTTNKPVEIVDTPEKTYMNVSFIDFKGDIIKQEKIVKGETPIIPEIQSVEGYIFDSWKITTNEELNEIIYFAVYNKIDKYKVTFLDYDGKIIKEEIVLPNEEIAYPSDPIRENYFFTHWSKDIKNTNTDIVIIAEYEAIQKYFLVNFDLDGGEVLSGSTTQHLLYGETPAIPVFVKDMCEFIGWDKEINIVTEDITYKAIFKPLTIKREKAIDFINNFTFGWSYINSIKEDTDLEKLTALLKEKNINVIQIAVIWMKYINEDKTITDEALNKLKTIVDYVTKEGFYVVICSYDTYEIEWSTLTYANIKYLLNVMQIHWKQIGEMFRDYDEKVVFSFLGEPRDYTNNGLDGEAYHVLNDVNARFVEFIRSQGGNNLYRQLIITTGWGKYADDAAKYFEMPKDDYVIVGVHAYVPFSFVHDVIKDDNGDYTEKDWEQYEDMYKIEILNVVQDIKTNFIDKDIPVIISEFGSRDKGNSSDRGKWLQYYLSLANSYNLKCFIWDGAIPHTYIENSFNIIDRYEYKWMFKELTDVISDLFVHGKFLDFFLEVKNYTQSISEAILFPKSLTSLLNGKTYNYDNGDYEIKYDQNLISLVDGKYYSKTLGPVPIEIVVSGMSYFYEITFLPVYQVNDTDFKLNIKENDQGVLQCYIETIGFSYMRVDYDWYSYDESIVTVSKYSSITIKGDGTTAIMAINKETKKVGIVEVVVKEGKIVSFNSVVTNERE